MADSLIRATMAGSLWKPLESVRTGYKGDLGMKNGRDFGYAFSPLIGRIVADGRIKPNPYKVVDGGLAGLEATLKAIRNGSSESGVKYVFRIRETPGLNS